MHPGFFRPEILALTAFFFGVFSGVFLKCVHATPPAEAVSIRTLIAFLGLGLIVLMRPGASSVSMGAIGRIRACLDAIAGLSLALAFFSLPLSLISGIHATLPLVSVALSAVILSEKLTRRTGFLIALALLGALLVLRPGLTFSGTGVVLAIVSLVAFALRDVATRRLPQGVDVRKIILLSLGLVTLTSFGLSLRETWIVPPLWDATMITIAAASFLCSTFLVVLALRAAPVTRIAPLRYTAIFWATFFDFIVWGYVPDPFTWAGVALIAIAGVLHQHHPSSPASA